jgi:transaldolase
MPPKKLSELSIKIFADGAEKADMLALAKEPYIKGLTTNPTLMHKAGVTDYTAFAKEILAAIPDKPISFEVFSDDFDEMERQAHIIASWPGNVYVKIPIINTKGESSAPLIKKLSAAGIKLNVTMILTTEQVQITTDALDVNTPAIISVFAGRLADVGIDPIPMMQKSKEIASAKPKAELLWASTRELFNIYEAERLGVHIITVPPSILKKTKSIGMSADAIALEGVKIFYEDSTAAGFTI